MAKGDPVIALKGDPLPSPWEWSAYDYLGRAITISVPFSPSPAADPAASNIQNGTVVHRDPGCLWTRIVFDEPLKQKPLPSVPEGDTTLSAAQVRQATGFRTLADLLAVQITAIP